MTRLRILVTGATGYLGSRLTAALAADPRYHVVALVRRTSSLARHTHCLSLLDVVRIEECRFEELVQEREIGLITHCATNYGRTSNSRPDIVSANLLLPLRLLDAVVRSGRQIAFVNTDTMLDKGISAYSLSKMQFRDWLQQYGDEVAGVNVRLEHFFGPSDDPTKFVSAIVGSLLRGDPRLPLTLGEQERDFVYIDDVVDAFLRIIEFGARAQRGFHEFEIGRGQPVRIRDFVELAQRLIGNQSTQLDFGALPYRANEAMRVVADTRPLRALGWSPSYDVLQGLNRMIEEERK